ncbi:hypothetical protein MnTg03_00513 [bacterium MnTg03]|nr:hypothetical protein MnTg03_00513 [bacterium MnTg03]
MKIFFSLLVIANIAFALVQWLLPYEQLVPQNKNIPVAEQLRLLDEPVESEMIAKAEIIAEAEAGEAVQETESMITEVPTDNRLCYTIGPFKDKTRALEVSARYSVNDVLTELKSSQEKEYLGIMVYISGHKTRQAAINTAAALEKRGFRDSRILLNEADKLHTLSLGVFGLKKNADRLISRLKKYNYAAESEPRYRERTIFWVYSEQSSASELHILLNTEDVGKGIGQIPRQCSESA